MLEKLVYGSSLETFDDTLSSIETDFPSFHRYLLIFLPVGIIIVATFQLLTFKDCPVANADACYFIVFMFGFTVVHNLFRR